MLGKVATRAENFQRLDSVILARVQMVALKRRPGPAPLAPPPGPVQGRTSKALPRPRREPTGSARHPSRDTPSSRRAANAP